MLDGFVIRANPSGLGIAFGRPDMGILKRRGVAHGDGEGRARLRAGREFWGFCFVDLIV